MPILRLDVPEMIDAKTGIPTSKEYLECGLPPYLQKSLENMKRSWEIEDSGKRDMHWDIYWCDLNAEINSAEMGCVISSELQKRERAKNVVSNEPFYMMRLPKSNGRE